MRREGAGRRFGGFSALGAVLLLFAVIAFVMLGSGWRQVAAGHAVCGLLFLLAGWLRGELGGSGIFNRRTAGVTVSSLGLIGFLLTLNIAANLYPPFIYDSTEEKIFTLAPQSLQVLASLQGDMTIRAAFLGGKVRRDVAELFSRLRAASPHISWSVIDPEREVALIEKLGINQIDTVHFSYQAPDGVRESKLTGKIDEQTVTNTLLKLTRGKPRPVYYVTGHSEPDIGGTNERGYRFLRESIEGENIALEDLKLDQRGIPADAAAVILAAPRAALLVAEREMIERYLAEGGRAVFLAEPLAAADVTQIAGTLGIEVGNDVILDKDFKAVGAGDLGIEPLVSSFGAHPITTGFNERLLLSGASSVSGGSLSAAAKIWDQPKVTELAFTSGSSWAEKRPADVFSSAPQAGLDPEDQHGPVSIAAAFEGAPRGGFDGQTRVVVIGDADFLNNLNLLKQFNKDFFLNCLNWVIGTDGGVTIRPATLRESKVSLTEKQFDTMFVYAGIVFPELIMIIGLIIWNARRW